MGEQRSRRARRTATLPETCCLAFDGQANGRIYESVEGALSSSLPPGAGMGHAVQPAEETIMRERTLLPALIVASAGLTGCAAIKGIFKAGVWTGVLGLVLLIALVGGGLSFLRGRSG